MAHSSAIAKFGLHFFLKDEDQPFMTVRPRFDNALDASTFAHHRLRDDVLRESVVVNVFQEQPCVMRVLTIATPRAVES